MKKSLFPLGETEMEILHHVWKLEKATVGEVHELILKKRKTAYTTIMTIMKNLHGKGYLKYEKRGVTYVYSPAIKPEEVKQNLLHSLLNKVFEGSPTALVQSLASTEELSKEDRQIIEKMIANMK
ncbi:MAG: BlaI/MecI/CopY family transcriptional regulator [Balneolales bacterium]